MISSRVLAPSERGGGTLRVVATSDCDSWDPQRTASVRCWNQQRWISRQLVTYAGAPGDVRLTGDLAVDVPASRDLRTWTYTLREGLFFEDGTPITSKDVKYGIERAFATDVISGGPGDAVDLLRDDADPYRGPYTDPTPDRLGLASVQTPDDRTITFHLNRPFADWNMIMASPVSTPVPRVHDTGAGYGSRPVSSGPYKIEIYRPGESLVLVRNPRWIAVRMGLSAADVDNRILTGQADVSADHTGVGAEAAARINVNPGLRAARTTSASTGLLRYLAVSTKVAPFDNVRCRAAVAWALDKRAQQNARGGRELGGEIASTMLTPPVRFYSWFDLFPSEEGTGNIARAGEELAACGQPGGFATTLVTREDPLDVAQAEAVRESLARAGITVTVTSVDESRFREVVAVPDDVHRMGYGLILEARRGDRPTPFAFLAPLADGRDIRPTGNTNIAELDLPEVNRSLDEGISTTDGDDAAGLWTALDKAVVSSAAYIPLLYERTLDVYSERLTNIYYSPAFMMTDLAPLGVVP